MNFFKIFIPKENAQTVTEIESWTVTWEFLAHGYEVEKKNKVFISEADAREFEKQLIESAKFIGCWIRTNKKKN